MKIAFRQHYVVGIWLLAMPAVLLCGLFGLFLFAMVPLFMAAPLLVALLLTLPVISDRPRYRPALVMGLFLIQVVAAYAAILLVTGRPTDLRRGTAEVFWFIGALLPFAIIALVLLGARRDARP